MKLQPGLVFAGLLALGLSTYSCANGDTVAGSGSGGNSGSGSGGSNSNSGGSTGSGGNQNKGGSTGSGGSQNRGGNTGSGGSVSSSGGNTGSGGSQNRGGNTGSGGSVVSSGGTTGSSGGTSGSGGSTSTGAGGGTALCGTSWMVATGGLVSVPSKSGCWQGYGFTYTEKPTCGSMISPTDFSTCTAPCALTATGMVEAGTSMNSYCGVVGLGFNINNMSNATPTGTGITLDFAATAGTDEIRVNLVDASGNAWCTPMVTPGSAVKLPYSGFKTNCWTGGTPQTAYANGPIAAIQIQAIGGATTTSFTLTLNSVTEY